MYQRSVYRYTIDMNIDSRKEDAPRWLAPLLLRRAGLRRALLSYGCTIHSIVNTIDKHIDTGTAFSISFTIDN